MITTDKTIDNKAISYEITGDGYKIYLDGSIWIHQYEPYIPYPEKGYEGSCLAQIEDLTAVPETNNKYGLTDEQLADLEEDFAAKIAAEVQDA